MPTLAIRPGRAAAVSAALSLVAATAASAGFTKATRHDQPRGCPAGSFLDLRLDSPGTGSECWSCPAGFVRTLSPVTDDDACLRRGGEKFEDADLEHKWGCDGSKDEFFDPRKGGECWRCPAGKPRRTLYKVTSSKACATKEILGEKLGEAIFVRKFKKCGGRSFFDPRRGGECWTCPKGYVRTAAAVTAEKACARPTAEALKPAKREGAFGCPAGQFLDPRNGGECWSCPAGKFRTVNPVDGTRACADTFLEIFAADGDVFCRRAIAALKAGDKGFEELQKLVTQLVEPVKKPLEDKLDEMGDLVTDATDLDELLGKTVRKLETRPVQEAMAFGKKVGEAKRQLKAILLDADLMCAATPKKVDEAIRGLGLLEVAKTQFLALSVSSTFVHPEWHAAVTIGLSWVTNLSGDGGLFANVALGATSSSEPASVAIGGMLFPNTSLADFGLQAAPGLTVSLGKGPGFDKVLKDLPPLATAASVVDSVDVAWNFDPKALPTLGVSKGIGPSEESSGPILEISAATGWDFPLIRYQQWALVP